ncbi:MAG TPA: hypothetical protein VIW07_04315 [Candidatus Udaeobacter sp.]
MSLRCLSRRERVVLGALCVCLLALLAALQHGRVFWGDEIGTLICLKRSPTYIVTHFETWLTMNYFILFEKGVAWLCGAADWRLTLLPIAAAVTIIPLTASLALKLTGSTRTALIAASLAAFNPYLVAWGPAIRVYSVLVALNLLALNEFFRWAGRRDWWSGARCATAVLLLLIAHLNGGYTVAFLILLLVAESICAGFSNGRRLLWESRTLWIPLAGVAIIVGAAYWRLLPDISKLNREWGTVTPPASMGYIPQLFTTFMGVGRAALLCLVLLLAGCWSAIREKRALLLLCGAIILPPIAMSLQGISVNTLNYARYLVFCLPLLLILMAGGIDWLARLVRIRGVAAVVAWSLTGLIFISWMPTIQYQFFAKKQWPYGKVAEFLHRQMHKRDVIVAGWNMGFTLSQYFDRPQDQIMLPNVYVDRVANHLDAPAPGRVFYVTGLTVLDGRKAQVRHFGQLEVTIYRGATARALLQEWRDDVISRTGGRVSAPFETDYQLLALLEEQLSPGQSADHWRSLAELCRAQNPARSSEVPRHLEKLTRAVLFP